MEENDQGTAPVEMDVFQRMEALLDIPDDGENEPEEETEEESTEETDEAEEETAEPEEKAEEPEPLEEITWNGETKKVSKAELKELAQKGFDYTQKTQQLADERKQAETQIRVARESLALQHQQIEVISQVKALDSQLEQFKGFNWHQLAESDPVQYLKLNQTYRDLKDERDGKVQEFQRQASQLQQMSQQQYQETLTREAKALAALPEFTGEKAAETKQQIKSYLQAEGFSEEEIAGVIDHRQVKIAWKAAQWDALKKSAPQVTKKVADVPKVVKPGTNKPQPRQADKDTYTQLKKSGRSEYAAKLIENMI